MVQWSGLKERAAGKWQFPLFMLSILMLAASFFHIQPDPARLPLGKAAESLDALVTGGLYGRALEIGEALLTREVENQAEFARSIYGSLGPDTGRHGVNRSA